MIRQPQWLIEPAVLAIHQRMLYEFGGAEGVRDQGLLDAALARPRHVWQYEEADIFELAAAYAFGIVSNHPFVDGNKRTGFAAAFAFLDINGYQLEATEAEVVVMTVGLAAKSVKQPEYAAWLRDHASKA